MFHIFKLLFLGLIFLQYTFKLYFHVPTVDSMTKIRHIELAEKKLRNRADYFIIF